MSAARTVQPAPHAIPGPPYSLVVVDNPDASNAFSYGFGPDGGGGVVVYSGFLDDVLSKHGPDNSTPQATPEETSWWSYLFGSFTPSHPLTSHPLPTSEQTSELAILLAHELAHLVLSHHIETISSGTIIIPLGIGIISDTIRALLFPITMLFGPFVNDAVAQIGKVGSGEISKIGEYCTSAKQEIEADVVSVRLLAHAGFDARKAVQFWVHRQNTPKTAECSVSHASCPPTDPNLARRIMGSTHPMNELRVDKLRDELVRWELERRVAMSQIREDANNASAY
jgi:Zn-dependent protease with chaperone function